MIADIGIKYLRIFFQKQSAKLLSSNSHVSELPKVNMPEGRRIKEKRAKENINLEKCESETLQMEMSSPQQKKYRNIYVVDKNVAKLVKEAVNARRTSESSSPVFEANPGPGLVTSALLQSGVLNLCVFENKLPFLPHLQELSAKYPGRMNIIDEDLISLPILTMLQLSNEDNRVDKIYQKIILKEWEDSPSVTIVAALSPFKEGLLRFFFAKMAKLESVFAFGRPEFFLFVSEKEYKVMTATEKDRYSFYRSASVYYKVFFHLHLIEKVSRYCFLPYLRIREKRHTHEQDDYYFVHLVPRADLFQSVVPKMRLPDLMFFIKQSLISRNNLVIPTIEKWIPDCGPSLMYGEDGVGIFTRFGELDAYKIVKIFQKILARPDYEESTLRIAVSKDTHSEEEL